jgi:phage terminase large subunit-like protein
MGKMKKRLVVIVGRTQRQTKLMIDNLKKELEGNAMLYKDMGPFKEQDSDLGSYTLYLPWYDAKIIAVSMEQTIRGIRHGKYRPDLILLDDIEDLESVKTIEGRDKIFNWIASEVLPACQLNTKVICIGNLLHEDSMLMRLKRKIQNKELDAVFMEIPLIDDNGIITWKGMYPNMEAVEKKKRQIFDEYAWHREYMLKIISDRGRLIQPEWIQTYNDIKEVVIGTERRSLTITSIDPAISKNENACKTAMISFIVYNFGKRLKIIVLPNPINERLTMTETITQAKLISDTLGKGYHTELLVEDVGMQKAFIQELERFHYPVTGFPVYGQDKRARLMAISYLVQDGTVIFPNKGCEDLINQIVNFDTEKYHDLADAFSMGLIDIIRRDNKEDLFEGVDEATASWEPDPDEIRYRRIMERAGLDPDIW